MAEPLPDQSDVRKRRTIVYIDAIDYDGERVVRCTVAGVALPEGCVSVPTRLMPGTMAGEADVGLREPQCRTSRGRGRGAHRAAVGRSDLPSALRGLARF
jgi:hypothetical protein